MIIYNPRTSRQDPQISPPVQFEVEVSGKAFSYSLQDRSRTLLYDMSLRAVRMQPGRNVLCLKWEVPFKRTGHRCPHEQCGQDIKLDPLDTPPRSYSELVEVIPCAPCGCFAETRV